MFNEALEVLVALYITLLVENNDAAAFILMQFRWKSTFFIINDFDVYSFISLLKLAQKVVYNSMY